MPTKDTEGFSNLNPDFVAFTDPTAKLPAPQTTEISDTFDLPNVLRYEYLELAA
jgi:hypothetical protein